jgi:hypothetical protein
VQFAFVDAVGKERPAVAAMHPKMTSTGLFNKLKKETGSKTGAYGSAWIDGSSLMLQLDKPLAGLVKKMRAAVKAAGFRVAKVVLWAADGTVFEQDDEPDDEAVAPAAQAKTDAPGPAGAPAGPAATAIPPAPPQPSATYETRLASLLPQVKKAAGEGSLDTIKHRKLLEFAAAKAATKDFVAAVAALKQVEQLLNNPAPGAAPGATEAGAAFKARLTALLPALADAAKQGRPGASEAKAKATEAGLSAGKRDFVRAGALLDEVEMMLGAGEPLAPAGEASMAAPRSLAPIWQAASDDVIDQLTDLFVQMRKLAEPELDRMADALLDVVNDYLTDLDDVLTEYDKAAAEDRATMTAEALDFVRASRRDIASDRLIKAADTNPLGAKLSIGKTMIGALDEVAAAFEAA